MQEKSQKTNTKARPPIVVVMGHVDHGKTSLLDYIRETKVAEKEAGGITQSIGAYEIEKNGQKITFIDTPGHQAFTKMRERGAKVADLAILVVAADDGVKPQTEEAITILQNSKTPFVVAINKIDKNNADIEKAKNDLLTHGVYLEKYGGDISWVAVSAKTGEGVEELLDVVLLMWQVEAPTWDDKSLAKGFILESRIDSGRGIIASAVIRDGILNIGDNIVTKSACGKIKSIQNFLGKKIDSAIPSSPVLILGFNDLPAVGEEFEAGDLDISIAPTKEIQIKEKNLPQTKEKAEDLVKIVLKADDGGSLEAINQIISNTEFKRKIKIISQEVGDITDGDIKSAATFGAIVIGFNTRISKPAESLARSQDIKIITSNIIYRIIEEMEDTIKSLDVREIIGILEILAAFSQKNKKQVIGGKVEEGYFTLNQKFEIKRGEEIIGLGRVLNLQKNKMDSKKVEKGEECGLMVESNIPIQVGDKLVIQN